MNVKDTILEEALRLFQQEGIEANSEEQLRHKLDISQATYHGLFSSKADLVKQVVLYDMERQQAYQKDLIKCAPSSIDEILILIQDGISNMKQTNPAFVTDLISYYPQVWSLCLDHLNTYSYHQLYDILNRGVQAGDFRRDINMQLVTKIMLEMVSLLLNPQTFPPEKYNLAEVYRSIYLYYIRGLCTEAGARKADNYFSRQSL